MLLAVIFEILAGHEWAELEALDCKAQATLHPGQLHRLCRPQLGFSSFCRSRVGGV